MRHSFPMTISPCIPAAIRAAGASGDRSSAPPTQRQPAPGLRQTRSNRLGGFFWFLVCSIPTQLWQQNCSRRVSRGAHLSEKTPHLWAGEEMKGFLSAHLRLPLKCCWQRPEGEGGMCHIPGKRSCSLGAAQGPGLNSSCVGSAASRARLSPATAEGEAGHGCHRHSGDKGMQTKRGQVT